MIEELLMGLVLIVFIWLLLLPLAGGIVSAYKTTTAKLAVEPQASPWGTFFGRLWRSIRFWLPLWLLFLYLVVAGSVRFSTFLGNTASEYFLLILLYNCGLLNLLCLHLIGCLFLSRRLKRGWLVHPAVLFVMIFGALLLYWTVDSLLPWNLLHSTMKFQIEFGTISQTFEWISVWVCGILTICASAYGFTILRNPRDWFRPKPLKIMKLRTPKQQRSQLLLESSADTRTIQLIRGLSGLTD